MKTYGGVEVYLRASVTSTVDGGDGQLHAPAALPSVIKPGTYCIGC